MLLLMCRRALGLQKGQRKDLVHKAKAKNKAYSITVLLFSGLRRFVYLGPDLLNILLFIVRLHYVKSVVRSTYNSELKRAKNFSQEYRKLICEHCLRDDLTTLQVNRTQ